ncbi:hypothetical protein C8R43DRAFT_1002173 [Mycena crocata]|nr:hypothetical protein C8R43DRAFT_1002173 [Mycena crocata]
MCRTCCHFVLLLVVRFSPALLAATSPHAPLSSQLTGKLDTYLLSPLLPIRVILLHLRQPPPDFLSSMMLRLLLGALSFSLPAHPSVLSLLP